MIININSCLVIQSRKAFFSLLIQLFQDFSFQKFFFTEKQHNLATTDGKSCTWIAVGVGDDDDDGGGVVAVAVVAVAVVVVVVVDGVGIAVVADTGVAHTHCIEIVVAPIVGNLAEVEGTTEQEMWVQ